MMMIMMVFASFADIIKYILEYVFLCVYMGNSDCAMCGVRMVVSFLISVFVVPVYKFVSIRHSEPQVPVR